MGGHMQCGVEDGGDVSVVRVAIGALWNAER